MNANHIPLVAALVMLAPVQTMAAEPGNLALNVGVDYSRGKYGGTTSSEMWYFPVTGKYETGPWVLRLTAAYLRLSGPNNLVGGERVVTGPATGTRSESGLGDVIGTVSYNAWYGHEARMGVDLGGKVKFATASRKRGLGTGENDYSLFIDLYKGVGATSLFATLGYKWLGEPPGVRLNDVWFGSLGGAWKLNPVDSLGLSYDWREKTSPAGSHTSEWTAFWSHRMEKDRKLQFYLVGGMSDGSPDLGLGANIGFGF